MKHITVLLLLFSVIFLSACSSSTPSADQDAGAVTSLLVSGGDIQVSYTRSDLEALPTTQAVFNNVTYEGVSVAELLQEAGFDLGEIRAVKAVAVDGYSVNYDTSQVLAADVIVAYARADGELAEDDGTFRMVLPTAEGKLNVRMLVELQILP
ncbi:MAG: molybdopterin-dependent oxidoreductase [Anaerolineales bacterium]|nr:molybdopterin-dependent oxidoreductase [Anaerolineales bacterium]